MRILFIGAVAFSAVAMRELIAMRAEVVGVCTLKVFAFNADHADPTPIAKQAGIPVRDTPDLNSAEVLSWIREREPDVIFCFGWSRLICASLLALPPMVVIAARCRALRYHRTTRACARLTHSRLPRMLPETSSVSI